MLDHVAFPHILDCVLSHADPDLLLLFRRTSSEVRALVDRLLFHVVAAMDETPDGRTVTLSSWGWEHTLPRADLSALSNEEALRLAKEDRARIEVVLARAAIVDILGPLSYNLPTLPLGQRDVVSPSALRGEVAALRLLPDREGRLAPPEAFKAGTLVVFAGAAKGGSHLNHVQISRAHNKVVVNLPVVVKDGVARWYSWDGHPDLLVPNALGQFWSGWAGEAVYIFHSIEEDALAAGLAQLGLSEPAEDDSDDGSDDASDADSDASDFDISEDSGWLALADSVCELVERARAQLTFVGFPALMKKGSGAVDWTNLERLVCEAIEVNGAVGYTHAPPSFVSHPAYRAAVGDQQYMLEANGSRGWPVHAVHAIRDNPRYTVRPLHEMFA